MLDLIYSKLTDPQFLLSMLVAIATMATILTVAMPLLETDTLDPAHEGGCDRARTHPRARARDGFWRTKANHVSGRSRKLI